MPMLHFFVQLALITCLMLDPTVIRPVHHVGTRYCDTGRGNQCCQVKRFNTAHNHIPVMTWVIN